MPHNEQLSPQEPIGVIIDSQDRGHFEDGKFMDQAQAEQIVAQQDQIREGLGEFNTAEEKVAADKVTAKENALLALADLAEQGKTLDAKTLRDEAGITFANRTKMGYHGSLDTMLKDAKELKAARTAEQAAQAEQQRIADYHATNKANADAWKTEKDAIREGREAANHFIDKAMSGQDRVERLTYKQRLEKGGELGMKHLAESSKMSEAAATDFARMMGHDVSHRQPRYHEVITNPTAEARASEMVAKLKEMTPKAKAEPEETSHKVLPHEEINTVGIQGRNRIVPFEEAPRDAAPLYDYSARTADMAPEVRDAYFANLKATATEPEVEEEYDDEYYVYTRNGLRTSEADSDEAPIWRSSAEQSDDDTIVITEDGAQRSSKGFGKIRDWTYTQYAKFNYAMGDPRNRRKAKIAVAAGVAGSAALLLFLKHDSTSLFNGGHGTPAATGNDGSGNFMDIFNVGKNSDHVTGAGFAAEVAAHVGTTHAHEALHSVTFQAGDNPWNIAEHLLTGHPSKDDIAQVTNAMIKQNHYTEAQSHFIPVGTRWHTPTELIEKLNKKNS